MINLALKQALRSQCRHRVGAVLTAGTRVIAASPNRRRNDPAITFLHATFHAEEAVLRRAARTAGSTIYVARVDAAGAAQLAKPCPRCQIALITAGVSRVHYTVDPHTIETLNLANISLPTP
ncbi:deaminase (plasmid) [Streptomyces sp. NBC_01717]|uniref:deaminase n=1 Tax=Streptomyces sp. NBC_01717 TaxID=2975918 RepID=UPI002E32A2F2|nr:deaminase [Streptomyces sp. NBC_01717]